MLRVLRVHRHLPHQLGLRLHGGPAVQPRLCVFPPHRGVQRGHRGVVRHRLKPDVRQLDVFVVIPPVRAHGFRARLEFPRVPRGFPRPASRLAVRFSRTRCERAQPVAFPLQRRSLRGFTRSRRARLVIVGARLLQVGSGGQHVRHPLSRRLGNWNSPRVRQSEPSRISASVTPPTRAPSPTLAAAYPRRKRLNLTPAGVSGARAAWSGADTRCARPNVRPDRHKRDSTPTRAAPERPAEQPNPEYPTDTFS